MQLRYRPLLQYTLVGQIEKRIVILYLYLVIDISCLLEFEVFYRIALITRKEFCFLKRKVKLSQLFLDRSSNIRKTENISETVLQNI